MPVDQSLPLTALFLLNPPTFSSLLVLPVSSLTLVLAHFFTRISPPSFYSVYFCTLSYVTVPTPRIHPTEPCTVTTVYVSRPFGVGGIR